MRTGEVEANLLKLNEQYRLPCVPELVSRKLAGLEQSTLASADIEFHRGEYNRLRQVLQESHESSRLPDGSSARTALNDLLLRLRGA